MTTAVVAAIVLAAMSLEAVTGFGATILALPFLSMLVGVRTAVAIMSTLSPLMSIWICAANRRLIDWRAARRILLFSGAGLPLGMLAFSCFPERTLKLIMGAFVTCSALRAILCREPAGSENPAPPGGARALADVALLFAGGAIHGAFASGGPLITLYAVRRIRGKGAFRATMTLIWIAFGAVLLVKNILIGGVFDDSFWRIWPFCLPATAAGMAIGNRLHRRVSVAAFTGLTNALLLIAGISTLLSQLL